MNKIVWPIVLALGIVLVAPGEYISAVCKSASCKDGCIVHTGFCVKQASGTTRHLEYNKGVVMVGACTDAATGGTPALFVTTTYDVYDDCSPDCVEPSGTYSTAAPVGKKSSGPISEIVKSQCNKGSTP